MWIGEDCGTGEREGGIWMRRGGRSMEVEGGWDVEGGEGGMWRVGWVGCGGWGGWDVEGGMWRMGGWDVEGGEGGEDGMWRVGCGGWDVEGGKDGIYRVG